MLNPKNGANYNLESKIKTHGFKQFESSVMIMF